MLGMCFYGNPTLFDINLLTLSKIIMMQTIMDKMTVSTISSLK